MYSLDSYVQHVNQNLLSRFSGPQTKSQHRFVDARGRVRRGPVCRGPVCRGPSAGPVQHQQDQSWSRRTSPGPGGPALCTSCLCALVCVPRKVGREASDVNIQVCLCVTKELIIRRRGKGKGHQGRPVNEASEPRPGEASRAALCGKSRRGGTDG